MIINSSNKDLLMKGMNNRGFNQTPKALKERLYNELHMHKTIEEQSKPKKTEPKQKKELSTNS